MTSIQNRILLAMLIINVAIARDANLGEGESSSAEHLNNRATRNIVSTLNANKLTQMQFVSNNHGNEVTINDKMSSNDSEDMKMDNTVNEQGINLPSNGRIYENVMSQDNQNSDVGFSKTMMSNNIQQHVSNDVPQSFDENFQRNINGPVNIPVQDEDYEMEQAASNQEVSPDIAISYSHFIPNYNPNEQFQTNRNQFYGNERIQSFPRQQEQASFIVHAPSLFQSAMPSNLILQELNAYALKLQQSPLMNALFSSYTVPIGIQPRPYWPSQYRAQTYLPPPAPQQSYSQPLRFPQQGYSEPNRRHLEDEADGDISDISMQDEDEPSADSPQEANDDEVFEEMQKKIAEDFAKNSESFTNFFNQKFQFPKYQFPAMQFPQFPRMPQMPNMKMPAMKIPSFNFPQFNMPKPPYLSPNLRPDQNNKQVMDIDTNTQSITQIGLGNINIADSIQSGIIQISDEDENQQKAIEMPNDPQQSSLDVKQPNEDLNPRTEKLPLIERNNDEFPSTMEVLNQLKENSTKSPLDMTTFKQQPLEATDAPEPSTTDSIMVTTLLSDSETTTRESLEETTITESSTDETTTLEFDFDDRIDPNLIKTLAG